MSTELAIQGESLIATIARAASDPSVDADKMRELWALAKDIQDRESQRAFWRDFNSACDEMEPIARDAVTLNGKGEVTNRYAKLEAVDRAIGPVYKRHGLKLSFSGGDSPTDVHCRVIHRDGHVESYRLNSGVTDTPNAAKNAMQAFGSTVSYLRRYLTICIFNLQFVLPGEDNDANTVPSISEDQLNALNDLVCQSGADVKKFCQALGIDRLENLQASRYRAAETALREKMRRAKGGH